MSQKVYPELLYPADGLRHRALNDVVNIIQLQSFAGACIEAQVLFDQITQLWTGPDRLLIWDPYGKIYGVESESVLHRWIVIDALYAARSVRQSEYSNRRLIDLEEWIKEPSDRTVRACARRHNTPVEQQSVDNYTYYAEISATSACNSVGQTVWAVAAAVNASHNAGNAVGNAGSGDAGPSHQARLRFKLLQLLATHGLLPEPVIVPANV